MADSWCGETSSVKNHGRRTATAGRSRVETFHLESGKAPDQARSLRSPSPKDVDGRVKEGLPCLLSSFLGNFCVLVMLVANFQLFFLPAPAVPRGHRSAQPSPTGADWAQATGYRLTRYQPNLHLPVPPLLRPSPCISTPSRNC
jgi:hypothetical protein